jgi:hypothetical protein
MIISPMVIFYSVWVGGWEEGGVKDSQWNVGGREEGGFKEIVMYSWRWMECGEIGIGKAAISTVNVLTEVL